MQRFVTPLVLLVGLLGNLVAPQAEAAQQENYYSDCPALFQKAVVELHKESLLIDLAKLAVDYELADEIAEELKKKRPNWVKLNILPYQAASLRYMLDQADEEVGNTISYLEYTHQKWNEMVNKANGLGVGHPRKYFAGADRAKLAALALQVRSGMQHTSAAHAEARGWEETALDFVGDSYLEDIEPFFEYILQQNYVANDAINKYFDWINPQPRQIVGIVVANLHAFVNDGPEGEITVLKAHPSYDGQDDIVDISDAFKIDLDGKTRRSLRVGFEIPYDAKFNEDIKGAAGELLAPEGTLLATKHNLSRYIPDFGMSGSVFENDGNGLTLHFRLLNANIAQACAGELPGRIVAGEKDSCALTLWTTGSPTQIANGETVDETYEIFAMGDGDRYLSFKVKIKANLERPSDPCYVWDPVNKRYYYDHASCAGGGNPGGGNPGGGNPGGGNPGGGNPGGGNPGGGNPGPGNPGGGTPGGAPGF